MWSGPFEAEHQGFNAYFDFPDSEYQGIDRDLLDETMWRSQRELLLSRARAEEADNIRLRCISSNENHLDDQNISLDAHLEDESEQDVEPLQEWSIRSIDQAAAHDDSYKHFKTLSNDRDNTYDGLGRDFAQVLTPGNSDHIRGLIIQRNRNIRHCSIQGDLSDIGSRTRDSLIDVLLGMIIAGTIDIPEILPSMDNTNRGEPRVAVSTTVQNYPPRSTSLDRNVNGKGTSSVSIGDEQRKMELQIAEMLTVPPSLAIRDSDGRPHGVVALMHAYLNDEYRHGDIQGNTGQQISRQILPLPLPLTSPASTIGSITQSKAAKEQPEKRDLPLRDGWQRTKAVLSLVDETPEDMEQNGQGDRSGQLQKNIVLYNSDRANHSTSSCREHVIHDPFEGRVKADIYMSDYDQDLIIEGPFEEAVLPSKPELTVESSQSKSQCPKPSNVLLHEMKSSLRRPSKPNLGSPKAPASPSPGSPSLMRPISPATQASRSSPVTKSPGDYATLVENCCPRRAATGNFSQQYTCFDTKLANAGLKHPALREGEQPHRPSSVSTTGVPLTHALPHWQERDPVLSEFRISPPPQSPGPSLPEQAVNKGRSHQHSSRSISSQSEISNTSSATPAANENLNPQAAKEKVSTINVHKVQPAASLRSSVDSGQSGTSLQDGTPATPWARHGTPPKEGEIAKLKMPPSYPAEHPSSQLVRSHGSGPVGPITPDRASFDTSSGATPTSGSDLIQAPSLRTQASQHSFAQTIGETGGRSDASINSTTNLLHAQAFGSEGSVTSWDQHGNTEDYSPSETSPTHEHFVRHDRVHSGSVDIHVASPQNTLPFPPYHDPIMLEQPRPRSSVYSSTVHPNEFNGGGLGIDLEYPTARDPPSNRYERGRGRARTRHSPSLTVAGTPKSRDIMEAHHHYHQHNHPFSPNPQASEKLVRMLGKEILDAPSPTMRSPLAATATPNSSPKPGKQRQSVDDRGEKVKKRFGSGNISISNLRNVLPSPFKSSKSVDWRESDDEEF